MPAFEYKVVPAPKRGLKSKGIKGSDAQFANALATTMNDLGADGWEYIRADSLPCEERQGLTGRTTVFQNMLIFRREVAKQLLTDRPAPDRMTPAAQPADVPIAAKTAPAIPALSTTPPVPAVGTDMPRIATAPKHAAE